ncbi:Ig-like domain-containing protein [Colwellia sp. 1_MG-2023]|uniref:Ig-like domain-containing protein n=1 Tax=unclassified Colwellia TaxID=196834 RepID=UPI001C08CACC|nr:MULTISPECIES: Ig-like domain-containing protein [unclassified Colwellia]MBU2925665.1 Ig-like domain-containing protein [Colwellia sp. C2M11]MDO6487852.1 Ig-like domain-containing protein [Colwellia sp. 6_MG-2023]MDO6651109.1 Ig-like domain-containing protein [Colwellia sp. 3_MG-2023]MDO6666403.1 Ig-like domain-containing protein [Colwellia sp. 2_MG-2023]MDO6690697.1 Ig-like domain-containing protein [Colwellia sp. 1_MG-2023]
MELLRRFSFTLLLMTLTTLVACGGGDEGFSVDGEAGSSNGSNDAITITLALADEELPSTLTATVLNAGVPLSNTRVLFQIDDADYGFFTPEKGTATTDINGLANITLNSGVSAGTGQIIALLDSGEESEPFYFKNQGAIDVVVRLGSGEPFADGVAELGLSQISAGATTVVTVRIIDEQGNLYKDPVEVDFSSRCTRTTPETASLNSPVTTSNGVATSTYLAKGCVHDDQIDVTANVGDMNLSATAVVNVQAADIGSIEFVSSSPEVIGILGTGAVGGSESSIIKFRVLDTNSNPVNNQVINFSLNSNVGGIKLIPESATTNSEGIAQTVVNSGTVATSVRVKAEIDDSDPIIASQSSLLVISTGIPDQDSFSLSADILNPEGWNIDGTEVVVTARLADAYNNPVPDGTAVSFTTEGGRIEPSCVTVNGTCSVVWNSQNTRPEGHVLQHTTADPYTLIDGTLADRVHPSERLNTLGQKYGGRATILATAIGEESFPDLNGNGRFDADEMTTFLSTDISGRSYDLTEAFVDHNEDGFYNPSEGRDVNDSGKLEEFTDFNSDNLFTDKDNKYNGVLCAIPAHAGCSETDKSINVRGSIVLVMSGSKAFFTRETTLDGVSATYDHDSDEDTAEIMNPDYNLNDDIVHIDGESVGGAVITISDLHNQPMPAGTQINFSSSVGSIVGPSSFVWGNDNHNGGETFSVNIKGETEPKSGSLIVEVITPSGSSTIYNGIGITIN